MKLVFIAIFCVIACLTGIAQGQTARELIEESLRRHTPPTATYEEHAMVISDRHGQLGLRTLRYYAQSTGDVTRKLHVVESPSELKGAAIQIERDVHDGTRRGPIPTTAVFGTNFLVADLEGEQAGDFRYERGGDVDLERVPHLVLHARPVDASVVRATGYHDRQLYLRKDNLFLSRVDYQDREGRPARRLSYRAPRADEFGIWRASMMLMEDLRDGRRTLLKVERRVHSPDYVPTSVFDGLQARR
ncbi:MAG: outer membrane lipoprotein-sorting protein [Rhodocyclales bacterium]|nr:outer membrane lipoprotein-sorting protein [Rhodocyclales bacterium]